MKIQQNRTGSLTTIAKKTLKDRYLLEGENIQEAFARAALAFSDDPNHAQRLYDYVSKQYFMFSTPILTNGGTDRGLPISCFLSYVPDSIDGLVNSWVENVYLTVGGGGIGNYFGAVRSLNTKTSKGTKSLGIIGFIKSVEAQMLGYAQGESRRGAAAVYLDVSHPEIEEFIAMRRIGGGDPNRKIQARKSLHNAVCISDSFMEALENDDNWDLIDPHSKEIIKTVKAKAIWQEILVTRHETGEPYIFFTDAANRSLSPILKDKGLRICQSNLCSEIMLPTNEERTAVCCLSSVNLEKYDEWKNNPKFIPDIIRMLDNVIQTFIDKAPPQAKRAVYSAKMSRDLGLGAMGFHAYLQHKSIPFESEEASQINKEIFSYLWDEADKASRQLAEERGECPDMEGAGRRNSHLLAIAPNASTGIIVGTSYGIEPYAANCFKQKTDSGTFTIKNRHLRKILHEYGQDVPDVWKSIDAHNGSVAHLEFLSDHEKAVFKTAFEIGQEFIVTHAADRQKYIDQGQSVNLFFREGTSKQYFNKIHKLAWKLGMKSLYYVRSTGARSAERVDTITERVNIIKNIECIGCDA